MEVAQPSQRDFFERVWSVVERIPRGHVTTYGHIAAALGARSSSRMVGFAMNAAHDKPWIPAHRVVNRNGELTGKMHFATPTLMRELLEAEDVVFIDDRVDLRMHLWVPAIES
ncbi:MAG: MGMT family protein [Candidatus Kapaibacterium sp.]